MDTAISNIIRRFWVIIIVNKVQEVNKGPDEPIRDNNKCPAIIFAVRRIAKVIGRIINLSDSIITIKGIRGIGVPWGVRWVRRLFKYIKILKVIIPNHIGRDKEKQNLICLVEVKMWGYRPMKLFNKIIKNNEINIIKFEKEKLIKILNSLNRNLVIMCGIIENRDDWVQIGTGKIIISIIDLIQLGINIQWDVEGSKMLKMFIIIFRFMKLIF